MFVVKLIENATKSEHQKRFQLKCGDQSFIVDVDSRRPRPVTLYKKASEPPRPPPDRRSSSAGSHGEESEEKKKEEAAIESIKK
ncbi:hypothetical protein QR680_009817 [Steinernema hermaphroditum]|uniref:Uncharacterized protein n=1 Tax=Steinernema hermaphroditum TaxID=289476 RepID=A0AA39ILR6_9BILA|nr:hypothetical protein QR680_009817 [Steinernema hermaphroditum]